MYPPKPPPVAPVIMTPVPPPGGRPYTRARPGPKAPCQQWCGELECNLKMHCKLAEPVKRLSDEQEKILNSLGGSTVELEVKPADEKVTEAAPQAAQPQPPRSDYVDWPSKLITWMGNGFVIMLAAAVAWIIYHQVVETYHLIVR